MAVGVQQLKSCPFCGGVAVMRSRTPGPDEDAMFDAPYFVVACASCDARGPAKREIGQPDRAQQAAAEAWNRRCR